MVDLSMIVIFRSYVRLPEGRVYEKARFQPRIGSAELEELDSTNGALEKHDATEASTPAHPSYSQLPR